MPDLSIVFQDLSQFLAACLVMVLAEAVYVSFGFGAGLIAVGLMAGLLPALPDVVVILLLTNLPVEIYVVLRTRRAIEWASFLAIGAGLVPGVILGTFALESAGAPLLLDLLGLFLVAAGLAFLWLGAARARELPAWSGPPTGALSGLLAGLFGTGGPPVIVYYQLRGVDKAAFRGTLIAIFFLITLVRLPSCIAWGLVTPPRIWSSVALLPAVLLGLWLGQRVHLRLSESAFRKLVSALLILLGINLLL